MAQLCNEPFSIVHMIAFLTSIFTSKSSSSSHNLSRIITTIKINCNYEAHNTAHWVRHLPNALSSSAREPSNGCGSGGDGGGNSGGGLQNARKLFTGSRANRNENWVPLPPHTINRILNRAVCVCVWKLQWVSERARARE